MRTVHATYIWIDGQRPTAKMRSKTKVFDAERMPEKPEEIPHWSFDGSSTSQAVTGRSDLELVPVSVYPDPTGDTDLLVLCEVYHHDAGPHESNTRAALVSALEELKPGKPWLGFEQEYTMYDKDGRRPLRWPDGGGYPAPQGKYYCGVGADEVFGRELVMAHAKALIKAGIRISGTNFEVMPSQSEYQVGPLPALECCDALWLSRWLMYRLGEDLGITVKLDPKPISGDWNGAGCHTNFSTAQMRESGGIKPKLDACNALQERHEEHIWVYGAENDKRLTGAHETCKITQFRYAVGHRGCSVRIPVGVYQAGQGYLEDRRPAANIDPYQVATALIRTVCGDGFDPKVFEYFYTEEHRVMMRGLDWDERAVVQPLVLLEA